MIINGKKDTKGNLILATRNGLIKKTPLTEYENIRKGGKIAIKLLDGDELIGVGVTSGRDDILIASHDGKAIRFNETDVRQVGRDSQGVKSMKLASGDFIVDMAIIKNEEDKVITITENGYGKQTKIEEFRLQQRGGMGVKACVLSEKTGKLVALKLIEDNGDIVVIADTGIIIRTHIDNISTLSRVSQGVKVMRLKNDAKIVSVALTKREEDEENQVEEITPDSSNEIGEQAEENSETNKVEEAEEVTSQNDEE